MSAALQLPAVWAASLAEAAKGIERKESKSRETEKRGAAGDPEAEPPLSLAFYRGHTQSLLRRYLYASTQVGRAPSILSTPVGRGWVSSRPVRSFEDAVIFVLDVEKCLNRLGALDRQLLSRIVLQEYTQQETAAMLGMCIRTVSSKLARALDRLTEHLLAADLLVIPD
jgi:RNA polymerase sigma factor (sigma-70 family)